MSQNDILNKAADTLLEKPIEIVLNVNNQGIFHKMHILPKSRKFHIKPITLGNLVRISQSLLEVEFNTQAEDIWTESLKAVQQHAKKMVMVTAYAIHGKRSEPPTRLISFLEDNLNARELNQVLMVVISQMNITDFMTSIISIKGMSLLKKGSMIAPGKTSAE